jgi:plasmid replication initiation protein
MFSGQLKPTTAFMTGKLKIEGNMGKAMSLEKLMGKMQKRTFATSIQGRTDAGKKQRFSYFSWLNVHKHELFSSLFFRINQILKGIMTPVEYLC